MARQSYLQGLTGLMAMLIALNAPGQVQDSAQQGASSKQALVYPVTLIKIDAVVTGKDGKYVDGLGPQNFALEEEGRAQVLTSVEHYVAGAVHGAADAPIMIDLKPAQNPEKLRPVVHDHRMIVLLFDLTTMTREEVRRAAAAAAKFVSEDVKSADLIAIASFGQQFRVVADFTNVHDALDRAVASLVPAYIATTGAPGGVTDDQAGFPTFNMDNRLYAVEALAGHLGEIPGRKSVIEFSGSVAQSEEINLSTVKAVANEANENIVSVYEVDMSDSTAPGAGRPLAEDPGVAAKFAVPSRSREVMSRLAHDTGGKLFTDVKDFAPIFKKVQDDSQDYYLLSYYSTNTKRDGLFRNVSVKLEKVRGAQIKFRPGYFAPKDAEFKKPSHH